MKRLAVVLVAQLAFSLIATAQNQPFKLGTFERDGRQFVGLVLRDAIVIDVATATAVIAHGESIRLPQGREQIDWECELGVVVGGTAARVPVARAQEVIFGYTIENDVSDRGGRGDDRYGSDWLIGKSHDTFAPMGPFIVPKEFAGDPRKLNVKFLLNGQLMQDASA